MRRERAGFRVPREHAHFLRHLAWLAVDRIRPHEGSDGVGAAYGEVGCASVLHDHNIVVVQVGRFERLLVQNDATKMKKTAFGVVERRLARIHPRR